MSQVLELRTAADREIRDAKLVLDSPNANAADIARANALIDAANLKKARAKAIEMSPAPEPISAAPVKAHEIGTHELSGSSFENEVRLLRAHAVGMASMPADAAAEWTRRSHVAPQAAGSTAPGTGGYSIAPAFMEQLLVAMKAQGGMRAASHCFTTTTGAPLTWPTQDDRATTGRLLTAENTQLAPAADLSFGAGQLGAWTFTSDVALVSAQLVQDSAFDFGALLVSALASRLARAENPYFTSGTGVNQPRGVLLDAPVGVTGATGSATSVSADNVLDLIASVDPAYRPGAVFMMNDATLQAFRKLKDSANRYLHTFNNDPQANGQPIDRIYGYPVVINQDMPGMAANATPILFGSFDAGYKIRTVVDLKVTVLRERYVDSFQVGYIAFIRSDGRMVTGAAPIKAYRNSAS